MPTETDLVHLQATAGNEAVVGMLEEVDPRRRGRFVQRSEISYEDAGETLYNQTPDVDPSVTPGTAGSAFYSSGDIKYEMVRAGDKVIVTVRIRFVDQARDTNRTLPDGTDNPNYLQHLGEPGAIPDGDPRRGFASRMCGLVTDRWNGKLVFVSKEQPAPGATEPDGSTPKPRNVRLPVSFRAVPEWDPAAENTHSTVRLYGPTVAASAAGGHPIDAGNYYMNLGDYVGSGATAGEVEAEQVSTYAHEYGHLLGLNDEYAQSNFQMHKMLHKISPTLGGERGAALDRATVERMVMAALTRPLAVRLRAAGPAIGHAFASLRRPLQTALADGLAAGASSPALNAILSVLLLPRTSPRLRRHIGAVVDFELGRNFSARQIARATIGSALSTRSLTDRIVYGYLDALTSIHGEKADVGGGPSGEIRINIAGGPGAGTGIWGAATGGSLKGHAGAIADSLVGPEGGRRVPPVSPSANLISQIEGIPAALETASAAAGTMITEASIVRRMLEAIVSAGLASDAPINTMGKLYREGYQAAQSAAYGAAGTEVGNLLGDQISPLLTANVSALRASVREEVEAVMSSSAGAVAATAPRDPEIAAVATAMKDRLAAQTPAGRTDVNPARPEAAASEPAAGSQEVTYSNTGMMSDNSADIRADQFERMVKEFNDRTPELRHEREDTFTAERGR